MRRVVHCCVDVRGCLEGPKRMLRGMFSENGKTLTPNQARAYLLDELAQGHLVLPMSNPPCEGFSYETGCPGHDVAESEA